MEQHPPLLGIKETCIYTTDLERSRTFYGERLGLHCFSHVAGSHAFFRAGTSVLLCFDPQASRQQDRLPAHFGEGELHFAFEVARSAYESWKEHLRRQGIPVEHEQAWPGGYRSVYFRDPDRHCLEIIEAGMWEYGGN
jgi:catechol 2,3-dioxygenase-like lactoylglutathione lyase family enzyme